MTTAMMDWWCLGREDCHCLYHSWLGAVVYAALARSFTIHFAAILDEIDRQSTRLNTAAWIWRRRSVDGPRGSESFPRLRPRFSGDRRESSGLVADVRRVGRGREGSTGNQRGMEQRILCADRCLATMRRSTARYKTRRSVGRRGPVLRRTF